MFATISYTIFVIIFAIITDRLRFVTKAECAMHCNNVNNHWFDEHFNDSKAQFWGSSLACFILGAWVVIGSIYQYNNPEGVEANEKKQI